MSTDALGLVSTDGHESKTNPIVIIAAGLTLYLVNSSGILNQIKITPSAPVIGVVLCSHPDSAEYHLLASCSDGSYHIIIISKTSKQLVESYPCRVAGGSFLPCCESITVLTGSVGDSHSSYMQIFGFHSKFGYQVINLEVNACGDNLEASTSVEWSENNCRLSGVQELLLSQGLYD